MQRMQARLHVRAQAARPFVSKVEGKMGYEDFVWFILSEEDKTNDVSLEYWFRQGPRCAHIRVCARLTTCDLPVLRWRGLLHGC